MKKNKATKDDLEKANIDGLGEVTYHLEVSNSIEDMNTLFRDEDHEEIIKNGSWFTKVLNKALNDNANLDADYFKSKYVGLDTDNIAKKIIQNASTKTAIAGATAATIVTGSELAIKRSKGTSIATIGATMMGEFASITYIQIKMIHELSILYGAELDKDDPEDLLTIFWFALGINKWEELSNIALKFADDTGKYLGRKALRHFKITKLLKSGANKFGGVQLAKKITEKGILKLIVPGVNIILAASINKLFTNKLGQQAITMFKNRTLVISELKHIKNSNRELQLLAIPLIYFIGIDGVKKNNKVIAMQNISYKYFDTSEDEDNTINAYITISKSEFLEILRDINDVEVKNAFAEIAKLSHNLSNSKDKIFLNKIIEVLNVNLK